MEGINQIGEEVVTFHFYLRWLHRVISKEFLCLTLARKSESLNHRVINTFTVNSPYT